MSLVHPVNPSFCLEKLCESNFDKLFQLIPQLCSFQQCAIGEALNKMALHIKIIERSKYTLTIELNYYFNTDRASLNSPAIKIRIYLDAKQAEVIQYDEKQMVSLVYKDPAQTIEIMQYKWRLNYFLQKWLDHCLLTPYQFKPE